MVFLISQKLFKNNFVSLGAALYYFTTPASYLRTAAGSFLREDFTLVFLLLSVLLILIQLDAKPKPLISSILGLVVIFNLSSWHFSNFVYISMMPFFVWMFSKRPDSLRTFFPTFIIMLISGFLIPVLQERIFPTSMFMCILYALFIAYFLKAFAKNPPKRLLLVISIWIALIVIRNVLGLYQPAYSHVFAMFFEKLRFLLKKPDDPLLLTFNARQLWESAFNSPTAGEVWWLGKLAFPLGIIGSFCLLWSERKNPGSYAFIAALSIVLFLLSIMAKRILVVAAPFVSVAVWGSTIYDNRKKYLTIGLFSLLILNSLGLNLKPIESGRYTEKSYSGLFEWINANTRPTDAFVAHIHLSPIVLLNTGRPEVLHPKFENLAVRKKYEGLIMSMYSENERDLFEFCRKNKAKYLIYDWGFFITDGKDSLRYLGGVMPDISEKAMATRLHFSSPGLKHFRPVFRNSAFIVYEVTESPDSGIKKLPYSPIYDPDLYTKEEGFYKNTRQSYDEVVIDYAQKVNLASRLISNKQAFMAVDILKPIVKKVPRGTEAVFLLGEAFIQLRQYEMADEVLNKYLGAVDSETLAIEPLGVKILELLADVQYYRGQYDESRKTLNDCLKLPLHSAEVYKKLGILCQLEQNEEEAERYFELFKNQQSPDD